MKRRRIWNCTTLLGRALVVVILLSRVVWFHLQLVWWGDYATHQQNSQSPEWRWLPPVTTPSSSTGVYSQVHCVGDNFLPLAWTLKSCQYRNLYWTHDTGGNVGDDVGHSFNDLPMGHPSWAIYPSPTAWKLHQAWNKASTSTNNNRSNHYARYSTSFRDLTVLPMAVHASHRRGQRPTDSWAPTVREWKRTGTAENGHRKSSWPDPATVTILDRIVVPIGLKPLLSRNRQNHHLSLSPLLTQVVLPIYNLLGLFGWQQETFLVDVFLWNHHSSDDYCDMECQLWLRLGIEEMLGYRLVVMDMPSPSSPSSIIHNGNDNNNNNNNNNTTCYRRGAVGMGFLSAHALSKRGDETKDYQESRVMHNVGRGATLFELVQHVWKQQNLSTMTNHLSSDVVQVQVALSRNGSRTDKGLIHTMLNDIGSDPSIQVNVISSTINTSIPQLLQLARTSRVWIANAKDEDQTWPALFLPRGSILCLLYDTKGKPQGQSSDHATFSDFGLWNHVSHLQVHWLALPRNQKDVNRVSKLIHSLILQHVGAVGGDFIRTTSSIAATRPTTDWTFQGQPLEWIQHSPPPFQAHCLGENWEWDVAHYRSCRIHNLCFDTVQKEFVIASNFSALTNLSTGSKRDFLATTLQPVMMGETIRFGTAKPWSPKSISPNASSSYYALPSNILWLPYYADVPNANNPGHLLWDFLFPLFTLMELFFDANPKLLLTNLDTDCIATRTKHACYKLTRKFLPLLGIDPDSFVHAQGAELQSPHDDGKTVARPSNYVCSTNAAIGIGTLTDHGIKKHGQLINDYQTVRNSGRGMAFWRFRNYMLANLGLRDHNPRRAALVITFSINSSKNPSRSRDFTAQIQILQHMYPSSLVKVQAVELGRQPLEDQLSIILESSIFVSVIGGAASTAMFLQRNSCLILYFNDQDDFVRDKRGGSTSMPAMLDWDFWNHASYLRVHWLPLSTMDTVGDLGIFTRLIEAELESSW